MRYKLLEADQLNLSIGETDRNGSHVCSKNVPCANKVVQMQHLKDQLLHHQAETRLQPNK